MTRTTTLTSTRFARISRALRVGAAHFDGPGGSQTPDTVADAIRHAMLSPLRDAVMNATGAR
jgi:selenocysteine lyase/cysteine desulfurase